MPGLIDILWFCLYLDCDGDIFILLSPLFPFFLFTASGFKLNRKSELPDCSDFNVSRLRFEKKGLVPTCCVGSVVWTATVSVFSTCRACLYDN